MRFLLLAAALSLPLATFAEAQPITGRASVIDGDTIEIAGQRIRLHGIDAPEGAQLCRNEQGRDYRCGQVAALALADWLDQAQPIRCTERYRDRWKRIVATCYRRGQDVGEWLVSHGHALDWPQFSKGKYKRAEREARARQAGMWRGEFVRPWEWRRGER